MCAQCMAGAAMAVGSASGVRAWLATRTWAVLSPRRLRVATRVLFVLALIGSSIGVSATTRSPAPPAPSDGVASETR